MNNNQLQVFLTSTFGDGCYHNKKYYSNCINEEYLDYKANLLGDLTEYSNLKGEIYE